IDAAARENPSSSNGVRMSVLWMLLFFAFSQWNSYCLGEPVTDCPQLVTEGESFTCECKSPTGDPSCRLSWPGHTEGPVLNIPRVRREKNGFICQMDCNGTPTTKTVTLNIACKLLCFHVGMIIIQFRRKKRKRKKCSEVMMS
ncbi:hypothetical protein BaRGS_00029711, partial [Batillaria attramentaria]